MDENNMKPANQGFPVMLVAQPADADDVLSFFDLWRTISRHKWLISVIIVVATGIGLLYALLATPVYRAETYLSSPSAKDIAALHAINEDYTPKSVFAEYVGNLNSKAVRNDFFLQHGLIEKLAPKAKTLQEKHDAFTAFDRSMAYKDGILRFDCSDAGNMADWLNGFVQYAARITADGIVAGVKADTEAKQNMLKQKISDALWGATQRRNDKIAQLKEALAIAEKLGVVHAAKSQAQDNGPLYLRGTRALRAELSVLQKSKDSAVFADGLRSLQEKLHFLDNRMSNIKSEGIQVVSVDEPAITPDHRIKPRRGLIVFGAFFIGLIVGTLAVLFTEAWNRSKQKAI